MPSERRLFLERLWMIPHSLIDHKNRTSSTHFADEKDRIALSTSTGLVLDLEMGDRKRISDGLFELCDLHWHFLA